MVKLIQEIPQIFSDALKIMNFLFFFNSKKIKLKAIKIALISLKIKMFFNSFWIIWSAKKIDFKKQVLQQFEKRNQ